MPAKPSPACFLRVATPDSSLSVAFQVVIYGSEALLLPIEWTSTTTVVADRAVRRAVQINAINRRHVAAVVLMYPSPVVRHEII